MFGSNNYDIIRDCTSLEKDKSFANLYGIICSRRNVKAAVWLENDKEKSITFKDMEFLCDSYAGHFSKILPSGRVCIALDSCKEWFPIFWGLVRSGHDILLMDATKADSQIEDIMSQTGCVGIVCANTRNLPSRFKQVLSPSLAHLPGCDGYVPVWGHDIALCTSGTTSDSRIFVYNESTVCDIALFSRRVFKENKRLIDNCNMRVLAFLPFHHVLGFAAVFIWAHFTGYTTVYLKDRSPLTITRTAKRCKVNLIIAVPLLANSIARSIKAKVEQSGILERAMFNFLLRSSLALQRIAPKAGLRYASRHFYFTQDKVFGHNIKSIILGGSHTDPESLRILNGIGYFTVCGYGMTETAITSLETSYKLSNRLRGAIGAPLGSTQYKIRPLDSDAPVKREPGKPGRTGELLVKGPGMHDGTVVNGKFLPPACDNDGWFATGDIVRIIEPLRQYFIDGRIKDVIINESGENVYPDELEDLFCGLEGVKHYTVLGLPQSSGHYEHIALVLETGGNIDDESYIKRLSASITAINRKLPVYCRLNKALVTADELPVSNGFKVKRVALKKMYCDRTLNARCLDLSSDAAVPPEEPQDDARKTSDDALRPQVRTMVNAIYSQVLNIPAENISPNANFIDDLGGDSLQVLSIITHAEESFSVMIPTESYGRCATVNGAVDVITGLLSGNSGSSSAPAMVRREPVSDFAASREYQEFKHRRDELMSSGWDPYFVVHSSPLLDTSVVDGRTCLDFGSYNYAGMSGRKEVSEAAKAAIDKYGTSASGSRLLAGEKPVHGELERELSEWKNAEAALVCVGGHSTNVTVVGNFCGKNDLILYDALAHNSIEQGCRLSDATAKPFPHNDVKALEKMLSAWRGYFEKVLIVIEGAYSMDGDIADVPAFVSLKKKYGCFLMVDEAHSSCVLGSTGGGVDEYFNLERDDIDIKMGTLSKGLGTCGGYIAGRKCLIDYLRYNLPGFVFSVGISPALAAGSLEAIRLLRRDPSIMERLHSNIELFVSEAKKRHLDIGLAGHTAVIPVIIGRDEDAVALSRAMNDRGILVPPALYPAVPVNKARLRFDVISEHKKEQIVHALDILVDCARELGINLPYREY